MKKLITIVLSVLLIFSGLSINVAAAEFSAELNYDKENSRYIITGTVAGNMGNVPMTLTVLRSNGDFYTGFQTLAKRNGSAVEFSFDPLSFPLDAVTDTYTLSVSSEFFTHTQKFYIPVFSAKDHFDFLKSINDCIKNGGTGIFNIAKLNAEYLSLAVADFELHPDSVKVFEGFVSSPYDIPAEFDIDDDKGIDKINIAWKKCSVDFFEALAAAELADINDTTDCTDWISQYYKEFNLDKENPDTAYSETKINSYFNSVKGTSAFVTKMAAITKVANTSDIVDTVNEAVLLSAIETMKYTAVSDIFTSFSQLFDVDDALYSKLTSTEIGNIYTKMAEKSYSSYLDAADKFDELAKAEINGRESEKGGGGSTGGGPSGGSYTFADAPVDKPAVPGALYDLSDAEWAREAVTYLVSKNIVQGRGSGKFEPNSDITRAEFIKIVVMALELPLEDVAVVFDDVNSNSWYASYVCAAKKAGIITGDDNNNFNPNNNISRQDMATILYRAYDIRKGDISVVFPDYNKISDYAREAVDALCSGGIINGMGDGSFSPLSNATRAQAAQLIYKIIK